MSPGVNTNEVPNSFPDPPFQSNHVQLRVKDQNITFKNLSEVASMSVNRRSVIVLGVMLTDELGSKAFENNIVLGTVCVENAKIKLSDLRQLMLSDIKCLPPSFCFLSKDGWPILDQQESLISSSHVITEKNTICIKRQFGKHRIGIATIGGECIGFVFVDLNCEIRQLREAIEQQLRLSQQLREYKFIERNGWPITPTQESSLSLMDILLGHKICIQYGEKISGFCSSLSNSLQFVSTSGNVSVPDDHASPGQDVPDGTDKKKKSFTFKRPDTSSSMKIRKESEKRTRFGKDDLAKPILISYVRAEAAQYALDLKRELVRLGFSVYLDVHEIKTGSDWQDALNFAVTHCYIFVPLITPMYGKTQWTNREVKLADVLGKTIVPVNFMEHWPPACLAIQFAATQYIPWRLKDSDHVKSEAERTDSRAWEAVYVKKVAKAIAESYKENYYKWPKRHPSNSKELSVYRSVGSTGDEYYSSPSRDDTCEDKKHNIVISAHPSQKLMAQSLKSLFEKDGHQVWCSVDCQDFQDSFYADDRYSNPNTPRELPTIAEEEVFFSQNDGIVNSDKADKEPEGCGRRPLSRLMSQFSDISQPGILSQEKLDRLRTFQQQVDQAGVVIVLVSEDYTKSAFCHQQVFYCEHRKRVVLVRCDTAEVPKWFRLLMGNDMIPKVNNEQFECVLKARVKRALNPSTSETPKDATAEAKINYLVNFLKRNLPLQDMCVYVTGSSKLQTQRAEEICRAIGRELSKMNQVSVVTGGYYGAADITAKTFYDHKENNCKITSDDSSVVHILPMNDSEDLKSKARQNPDGSFEAVPYGKTVFLGDSVKERETVVARFLDTCIVIEGGPGVVHEIEEFIWNDHFVIPVMSTGGAAAGKYGVPMKIFELPPNVDKADWSILSDPDALPDVVAKAVVNIMVSLKKALASPTATLKSPILLKRKSRKKIRSKKYKVQEAEANSLSSNIPPNSIVNSDTVQNNRTDFSVEVTGHHGITQPSSPTKNSKNWWHRVRKIFGSTQ